MSQPLAEPHRSLSGSIRTFPIPCHAGHDVVYGLARGRGNEIYLAASNEFSPGLCAQIFAFDTVTEKFRLVVDVAQATGFDPASGLMPHCKIHLCLNATSAGRMFAATHFTAPGVGQTDFEAIAAYRQNYPGCFFIEYDPVADRVINHGRLLPGEGARISCLDETRGQYYFISYPRSHLYRYDYEHRQLYDLGRIGQENSFGLEVDERGDVYTSDDLGRIVRYVFARNRLEETALFVPLAPGRRPNGNYIRRMTRGIDGCFYGFANKGARLFRLDPRRGSLEDFGVIYGRDAAPGGGYPNLPPAKALVQTDARTLFITFGGDGIYRDGQPIPNLIQFDLVTREVVDHGKLACPGDGLPSWIPQCAVTAPGGNALFIGLQQTVGQLRLWKIDLPPHPPGATSATDYFRQHLAVIRDKPFGASVEGTNALPFVKRGHVTMHELGWPGEDRLIPAEETAIADLRFVGMDCLYGVTTGRRSHLFAFRPYRQTRFTENYETHPWDLGIIAAEPTSRARLFDDPRRNRLVIALEGATHTTLWAFAAGSELARYRGIYHSMVHWPPVDWSSCPFTRLAAIERMALSFESLAYHSERDIFLGASPEGALRRIALGGSSAPSWNLPSAPARPHLLVLGGDRLLAVGAEGERQLFQLDASGTPLDGAPLPTLDHTVNCVASFGTQNRVAVGSTDGRVTIFPPEGPGVSVTARLPHPWKVRSMAWTSPKAIYGFYGEDQAIGEAFRVDAVTGEVGEIGILQVSTQPRYWMAHRCDAVAAGGRGEIYFGESDRLAHLFVVHDRPELNRS